MGAVFGNRFLRGFVQLADPKIWVASTVPMFVAAAVAYADTGRFSLGWFILTLVGIYAVEIGKNAVNEIIDYDSGADRFIAPEDVTPFSGGKKTITGGLLSRKDVLNIAVGTFLLAGVIGLLIGTFRTPHALWIAAIGGFLSIAYSWPLALAYRGLGELTVGLTFGPLLTLGTYVVQTGQLSDHPLIFGIPLGILIAAVLWINEFPDVEADRKAGKYNLVARMGKARARVYFAAIMALGMASVLGLAAYFSSPWLLLGLVGIVEAYHAVRVCWHAYGVTSKLMPANASTVKTYILTGIGILVGTLLG